MLKVIVKKEKEIQIPTLNGCFATFNPKSVLRKTF